MNGGEISVKSLIAMCSGAFIERADYEIPSILKNLLDPNTSDKAKRSLTMTFTLTPKNNRQQIDVECVVKTKLAPTNPIATSLYVAGDDSNGNPQIIEMTPQIPGQRDMAGAEQETPPMLRVVGQGE